MAEPRPLTLHIETYVSSSSSTAQQNASIKEIAALVQKGSLTVEALVRELELYLITTDVILRGRGVTLLAEVLARLSSKRLNEETVHSLTVFFSAKLADWHVVHGSLLGCLSLLRRRPDVGAVQGNDVRDLALSYLQNLQVQALGQNDRVLCFELLQCLLDSFLEDVAPLGDHLVYGICEAIDGEMNPQCLLHTFHIVESLGALFPDPSGPVANYVEEIFDILSRYFPISFSHSSNDINIRKDALSNALMLAFSSTTFFEPFVIPLLLEKLSSELLYAKIDSLKFLRNCILHYGADKMSKYSKSIWSSLKEVIFSYPVQESFDLIPESTRDKDSQENLLYGEAIICLQTAMSHLNISNNSFISGMLDDGEFDLTFTSFIGGVCYKNLPDKKRRMLHVVGDVLSISAKVSHAYCDNVFQRFFCPLVENLGATSCKSASDCMHEENTVQMNLNFGALYLLVKLLDSCWELVTYSGKSFSGPESFGDTWQHLLRAFHKSLTCNLASIVTNYDLVMGNENGTIEHVYYAVKGLQTLAKFPSQLLQMSSTTYEYIIKIFMSILVGEPKNCNLWKFILKALVEVGTSLSQFPDSEKERSYQSCALGKIICELDSHDSEIMFSMKLEAAFAIGSSRPEFISRVIKEFERLIFSILREATNKVISTSTANLVRLLEFYSSQVLPCCSTTDYLEGTALQFAIEIWNQMEDISLQNTVYVPGQEISCALMTAIRTAVGICKEDDQLIILKKAYKIVQLKVFSFLETTFPNSSINSDLMQLCPESCAFNDQQKMLFSLFASVLVALRPQTPIPHVKMVLTWLMIFFLKGNITSAHALGSIVNKWPSQLDRTVTPFNSLEEALDYILVKDVFVKRVCVIPQNLNIVQDRENILANQDVVDGASLADLVHGLAWIGKGLLMRGHERVKDVTRLLLTYLLETNCVEVKQSASPNRNKHANSILARAAADSFEVLLSDSDVSLNQKLHAIVKPLYKQKFFSVTTPILLSCIADSNLSTRIALYRAFGHVVCNTPPAALFPEAKKLILPFMEGLSLLSQDIINKDLVYSLLLSFSGFLMDDIGKEAVIENAHKVINCFLELISYPYMMLVRETAIQCLLAVSGLPHARIYPMRQQVLQAISKAVDDPKRHVRFEAVKCLRAWTSLA